MRSIDNPKNSKPFFSDVQQSSSSLSEIEMNLSYKKIKLIKAVSLSQSDQQKELDRYGKNGYARAPRKKSSPWTRQENIKYIAFLQAHEIQYVNKRRFLLRECCQFATDGDYWKVSDRNETFWDNHKTLKDFCSSFKKKYCITEDQVEKEKRNLMSWQKQRLQMYEKDDNSLNTEYELMRRKNKSHLVELKGIKILFKQRSSCFKIQNYSVRVFSLKKQNSLSNMFDNNFLAEIELKITHNKDSKDSCVSLLKDKKFKYKQNPQVIAQDVYQFHWMNNNRLVTKKIIKKIRQAHEQENTISEQQNPYYQSNAKCQKTQKKKREQWTYIQNLRFLLFLSIYQKKHPNLASPRMNFIQIMAQFVKSKSADQCEKHFWQLSRKYASFQKLLDGQLALFNTSRNQLKIMVQAQLRKSKKVKEKIMFLKQTQRISFQQSFFKLNPKDQQQLIITRIKQDQTIILKTKGKN